MKNEMKNRKGTLLERWFEKWIIKKQKDEETINKRKNLTKQEQINNHLDVLFYDVSNDALKQTIKDTYNAFVRYFKKIRFIRL